MLGVSGITKVRQLQRPVRGSISSPRLCRWLVKADRWEEALHVLQRLRGTKGEDSGKAEAELSDIRSVVELERKTSHQNTYFHMFFGIGSGKLHTGRRVQLCIWLQIMQSWTGISGVTMFGPSELHTTSNEASVIC